MVSFKASKDDGGAPIKHYLIEKMDTSRGTWSEVGNTLDLKFKIPKLIYRKRYQFRVKAVNEVGESDPLESKEAIVAKDAYGQYRSYLQRGCKFLYCLVFVCEYR